MTKKYSKPQQKLIGRWGDSQLLGRYDKQPRPAPRIVKPEPVKLPHHAYLPSRDITMLLRSELFPEVNIPPAVKPKQRKPV